jgi:hypothetical protein
MQCRTRSLSFSLYPSRPPRLIAMAHLPAELLDPIFREACTDGGQTGSALMLASRRISELARPYRFRAVAVSGLEAIEHLVYALERTPRELRVIEHLFVSDKRANLATDEPLGPYSRFGVVAHTPPASDAEVWEACALLPLLSAVFCYAAPHVRTLTLLLYNQAFHGSLHSLEPTFSALVHLTLRCPISTFTSDSAGTMPKTSLDLPALRELALVIPPFNSTTHIFMEAMLLRFPPVRHFSLYNAIPSNALIRFLARVQRGVAVNEHFRDVGWTIHLYVPPDARKILLKRHIREYESFHAPERIHVFPPVDRCPTYAEWRLMWTRRVHAAEVEL